MATCPACEATIGQFAIRCDACGYDFPPAPPPRPTVHDYDEAYHVHATWARWLILGGYLLIFMGLLAGPAVAMLGLAALLFAMLSAARALYAACILGLARPIAMAITALVLAGLLPLALVVSASGFRF